MTLTAAMSQDVKYAGDKWVLVALAHQNGRLSCGKASIERFRHKCGTEATLGFVEQCLVSLRDQGLVEKRGNGSNKAWVIVDD